MRRLVVSLVALALALFVVDLAARFFVESRVESEFRQSPAIRISDVDFTIDSFPFVGRLGLLGEVSATLVLRDVEERGVRVDEFELEVHRLTFDRARAFRGGVLVTDLDRARAAVRFEEATLTELLGVTVEVGEGTATAGGVAVSARLAGEALVVGAAGIGEVSLQVPVPRYLPCEPEVGFRPGVVEAACTTEEVPPVVNEVIGRAPGGS